MKQGINYRTTHPDDSIISGYLDNELSKPSRKAVENHIAGCDECLIKMTSAYEAVKSFGNDCGREKRKVKFMRKMNIYLILSIVSFALSFIVRQYFIQLLAATLLLGLKWVADSRSTKMLIMINEAWKRGGGKEANRILETLNRNSLDK